MSLVGGKYSPIWAVPLEEFKEIVKKSWSYNQVAKEIGLRNGGFIITVKNRIRREKIDASHFDPKRNLRKKCEKRWPFEEIFKKDSGYCGGGSQLKKKLYDKGLKGEVCESCMIGPNWNNKGLVLQLDHINGVHNDNRIENLRILCPNCHSQTDTFCAKNIKKTI